MNQSLNFGCTLLLSFLFAVQANAQLEVNEDGTTSGTIFYSNTLKNKYAVFCSQMAAGITSYDKTPDSYLNVGGQGRSDAAAWFSGTNRLYAVQILSQRGTQPSIGLFSECNGVGNTIAIEAVSRGAVFDQHANLTPFHIGIRGKADETGKSGISIGVSALQHGRSGTAFYAGNTDTETLLPGQYAVFVNGNASLIRGTLNATLTTTNDPSLQTLSDTISDSRVLSALSRLQVITYKPHDIPRQGDVLDLEARSSTEVTSRYDSVALSRTRFGFSLESLRQTVPDLLYHNPDSTWSADYIALIPLLAQGWQAEYELTNALEDSIASLNARIANLQEQYTLLSAQLESLRKVMFQNASSSGNDRASLSQNVPNPFTDYTEIAVYLPATVSSATLYLYTLSGQMIKDYTLTERGNIRFRMEDDGLPWGRYLYTLIADGAVVDTKYLILE